MDLLSVRPYRNLFLYVDVVEFSCTLLLTFQFFFFCSQDIDEPALIPHIAEANSKKYPYEVLFRSLHKLLMDTAVSEYYHTTLSDLLS